MSPTRALAELEINELLIRTGEAYPLGATYDGAGINFAIFSEHAERVNLCLFDDRGENELVQIRLPGKTGNVWHGYIEGLKPGTLYGYRVFGPYLPECGHRFNANKLLLDPYARSIKGEFRWDDSHFGYRIGESDLSFDKRDNAAFLPKCEVIDSSFDWGEDARPQIEWRDSIIYELHVKGFSALNPHVPESLRGTYLGLSAPGSIRHLKRLGITAVELMPVHYFLDERNLVEKGLSNYWGYNTIGFFAPASRYARSDAVTEFKTMVKRLHAAGIEVILDVVYNHSAEGNHYGPTISFKGIDNASYYRLVGHSRRHYMDYTGCGNTLNVMQPRVLQLIMDSLRYWVLEMRVDGFRFDLAAALARETHAVDRLGAFFDIIHQDPVLSQVKLIAEPWDLGEGGYQLGNFPQGWSEWNGSFRDNARSFWRSDEGQIVLLSRRLTGSSDLYQHNGRGPCSSINFVTCHDGFSLEDLVSYNHKHNELNLDRNTDGDNHNLSWNCGAEGETPDREVKALRRRQKRNLLATLLLSHGVPMLSAGDEIGRSQGGNNNAYCQDNKLNWLDWNLSIEQQDQLEFVRELIQLRREHLVFRRRDFTNLLFGQRGNPILWFTPKGYTMRAEDWHKSYARCVGLMLCGEKLHEVDDRGKQLYDDSFLVLFNAHWEEIKFTIPVQEGLKSWQIIVDTAKDRRDIRRPTLKPGAAYRLAPRSMVVLICERTGKAARRSEAKFSELVIFRPREADLC